MKNNLTNTALTVGVIAILGIATLANAARNEAVLMDAAQCVALTAEYNGYSGNVHSAEAWELFINECN